MAGIDLDSLILASKHLINLGRENSSAQHWKDSLERLQPRRSGLFASTCTYTDDMFIT